MILTINGECIGFYGLECQSGKQAACLENLWVDPIYIGQGYGRLLFDLASKKAAKLGNESMVLIADPNAEVFYVRVGAAKVGEVHSQILGVKIILPKMQIKI